MLLVVNAHDFLEQAKIVTTFSSHGAIGGQVLGKTGAAVADARPQKLPAYARIGTNTFPYLVHVSPYRFTNSSHRIDEADIHRQEGVGGVLDEFGALGVSHKKGRRGLDHFVREQGISPPIVASVEQRLINKAQTFRTGVVIRTNYDAIRIEEIGDRRALPQELRIGGNVEQAGGSAVEQHDLAHPFAGVHRHGTLANDDFVLLDGRRNFARDRFNVGKIGLTIDVGGSADCDKDRLSFADRVSECIGELEPGTTVALEQLRHVLLVNRAFASLQSFILHGIVIDQDDIVA